MYCTVYAAELRIKVMLPALEENYSFTLIPELSCVSHCIWITNSYSTINQSKIVTALTYTPLIYQYRSTTDPHAVTRSAFICIGGGTGGLRVYSPPNNGSICML